MVWFVFFLGFVVRFLGIVFRVWRRELCCVRVSFVFVGLSGCIREGRVKLGLDFVFGFNLGGDDWVSLFRVVIGDLVFFIVYLFSLVFLGICMYFIKARFFECGGGGRRVVVLGSRFV